MNKWVAGAACAVAVACGSDLEVADELVADAGLLVHDAGQALVDAGAAMADADIAPVADAQQAPVARAREAACSIERVALKADGSPLQTDRFASFDVDADEVRQAWMCDPVVNDKACPGSSCTGAEVPKPECHVAPGTWTAGGKVWVSCGNYRRARLVLD